MAKKRHPPPQREPNKRQLSRRQQQERKRRLVFTGGLILIGVVLAIIAAGWYITSIRPLQETVIKVNDTKFSMGHYIKMIKAYPMLDADTVVLVIQQNELIKQAAADMGISVSDDELDAALDELETPLDKDYREAFRTDLLGKKLLKEHFEQEVSLVAEQRRILAMFLESQSQAEEVRERITTGEAFSDLAGDLSLDAYTREQNGDTDWHPRGILRQLLDSEAIEEFAFSAEYGTLSEPIYDELKTKPVGYWIVSLLNRKADIEVRLKAILLGTEEEAIEAKEKLLAGESFDDLAKEISLHEASRGEGGELGTFTRDDIYPPFEQYAFSAEEDTFSEPIRDENLITQGGYWLLMVEGIDTGSQISDDDRQKLKEATFNDWAAALWDDPENIKEHYLDDDKIQWAINQVIKELSG